MIGTMVHGKDVKGVGDEFYIGGIRESWWGFIDIVMVACIRELSHALFRVGLHLGDVVSTPCAFSSLKTDIYVSHLAA